MAVGGLRFNGLGETLRITIYTATRWERRLSILSTMSIYSVNSKHSNKAGTWYRVPSKVRSLLTSTNIPTSLQSFHYVSTDIGL